MMRKLNALKFDDNNIINIKNFIQYQELPPSMSDYEKERFKRNYKDFVLENDKLIYKPNNLQVIPTSEINQTLEALYKDPVYGLGAGIKTFYSSVNSKYLNITRKDVKHFLETKTTYQLTKTEPRPSNKPVFATYSNQRWGADLVDVKLYAGYNNGYKFILTAIDFFTKKAFATGIFDNTAPNVIKGFEDIIDNQSNGTTPNYLQTDNGPEFTSLLFQEWCKNNNIKLIHTLSYTPQSNGLIEGFNGQLRKLMRENFIRNNNEDKLNWRKYLPQLLENKNERKHTTTKVKPNDVWREGSTINKDNDNEISEQVRERIKNYVKKEVAKNKSEILRAGDKVRVLMSSLYSEVRAIIKSGRKKLIPVMWSPNIYTIKKRERKPRDVDKDFYKPSYTLLDSDGNLVLSQIKLNNPNKERGPKRFFATELQKIDEDKIEKVITQNDALKINNLGLTELNDEEKKGLEIKKEIYKKTAQEKKQTQEPIIREASTRERKKREILDL